MTGYKITRFLPGVSTSSESGLPVRTDCRGAETIDIRTRKAAGCAPTEARIHHGSEKKRRPDSGGDRRFSAVVRNEEDVTGEAGARSGSWCAPGRARSKPDEDLVLVYSTISLPCRCRYFDSDA